MKTPPASKTGSVMRTHSSKIERPDRKYDILLAAEKLFAQKGFHAVSIRDIAEEAQVPLALVGYYYGQKHELYHAIFEHWSSTIEERLNGLRQAMVKHEGGDQLQQVVAAFVEPVIRLRNSPEGEYYALLMSRGLSQQSSDEDLIIREFFDPLAIAFIDALYKILRLEFPGATHGEVAWCYQFLVGCLLHHITDTRIERLSKFINKASSPEACRLLVSFAVHGIRGALQASTKPPSADRKKKP